MSAKSRNNSRTPSAKRCGTANSTSSHHTKASLLFPGQLGTQTETLANFRQIISQRISEDLAKLIWIKIVLVGPQFAGKTSLIRLFCESKYQASYQPTIGVDYGFKIHTCRAPGAGLLDVRVNFWDTSGKEEFFQVRNELYTDTDICLLVGDVSNSPSVQASLLKEFRNEVDRHCRKPRVNGKTAYQNELAREKDEEEEDPDIAAEQDAELERIMQRRRPFMLAVCANKCDLLKIGRNNEDPSLKELSQFAAGQDLKFYQTSCTGNGTKAVEEMFGELIEIAAIKKLQQAQSAEFLTTGTLKIIAPDQNNS